MGFDHERFLEFELDHALYDLEAEGVPLWERIRTRVAAKIRHQSGVGTAHTLPHEGLTSYAKGLGLAGTNLVRKNPFLAAPSEIVFVGHPRRKQLEDGCWWDLYTDPVHEALDEAYLHLEFAYQLDHSTPIPTDRVRYMDLPKYGGEVLRYLGVRRPSLPRAVSKRLQEANAAIDRQFDATIDLEALAIEELHKRATRFGTYTRILDRIDPELLVLVVSYDNEIVIEAAHELGIPVVELQHGVIHEQHYGYAFPGPRTKTVFPDYLLTFGSYWGDAVDIPLPDDRIIPTGYPYLDQRMTRFEDVETRDQVLVISQGTIGEELSKFAMRVADHPDRKFDIVYKLHPGEYDRWKDEYPWLVDADFEIVDSSERSLYRLFAESSAQIGVGSTAVYEGLAFDLETFVYDCTGSDVLDPLIESGSAKAVSTPGGLVDAVGGEQAASFDRESFFNANATERTVGMIETLKVNATVVDRRAR